MNKPESHPGVPLFVHLSDVAKIAESIASDNTVDFEIGDEIKKDLIFICGFYHDLGKATSYFQEYLHHPDEPHTELKNHALPSAAFVFYVTQEYLKTKELEDTQIFFLSALNFIAVRRHHGNLGNFKNELGIATFTKNLQLQFQSIEESSIEEILLYGNKRLGLNIKWMPFLEWFNGDGFDNATRFKLIEFYQLQFKPNWERDKKAEAYYLFLWMFGVLLYSDKSDVILAGGFPAIPKIDIHWLNDYRKEHGFDEPKSKIDGLKNEAYFSVLTTLQNKFTPRQHLYSITLPTGLGKTLTSLGAALKIKELAKLDKGRIIIAIPFTSIIDQNFEVYQKVFKNTDSSILLKHHHLTELKYKEGDDGVRNTDESQHLIETWQSAVVVTTFVQLIETLITNNKGKLLKFSSLSNSVIILDEVQQIPHRLWELIRVSLFSIAKNLNCYIILMSATQPLIFRPDEEITELVDAHEKYFTFFNRTKLINKTSQPVTLREFTDDVTACAESNLQKDILIILNTKKSALTVYRDIYSLFKSDKDTSIYFLTTLVTPFERKERIAAIKKASSTRKIIVSTQLVEAGVDISVDVVFRDFAPLDSIIQAAGRANRYDEKTEAGIIYLYKINEEGKSPSGIYGADLIKKTENIFKGKAQIVERDYLALIREYYIQVKDLSRYMDENLLRDLINLEFEETGKFNLIKAQKTESVFIGLNDEARAVWKNFLTIQGNVLLQKFDKKKKFSEIRSRFYDYVINVSLKYGQTDIGLPFDPTYGFYYVDVKNQISPIYNCSLDLKSNQEGYIFGELNSITF